MFPNPAKNGFVLDRIPGPLFVMDQHWVKSWLNSRAVSSVALPENELLANTPDRLT